MNSTYTDEETGAKAEITEYSLGGYFQLTNIFVPRKYRKRGHGSRLLREVVQDADKMGYTIYCEITVADEKFGLGYDELRQWIIRHGFKYWKGKYRRLPIRRNEDVPDSI